MCRPMSPPIPCSDPTGCRRRSETLALRPRLLAQARRDERIVDAAGRLEELNREQSYEI